MVRIVGTHFDLTERQRAEAERARTEMLARLIFAQEDERRRIAREMHDQFGEQLTTPSLRIGALKEACRNRPNCASRSTPSRRSRSSSIGMSISSYGRSGPPRSTTWDRAGGRQLRAGLVRARRHRRRAAHRARRTAPVGSRNGALDRAGGTDERRQTLARAQRGSDPRAAPGLSCSSSKTMASGSILEEAGTSKQGFGLLGMQERALLVGATLELESYVGKGTTILVRMATPRRGS